MRYAISGSEDGTAGPAEAADQTDQRPLFSMHFHFGLWDTSIRPSPRLRRNLSAVRSHPHHPNSPGFIFSSTTRLRLCSSQASCFPAGLEEHSGVNPGQRDRNAFCRRQRSRAVLVGFMRRLRNFRLIHKLRRRRPVAGTMAMKPPNTWRSQLSILRFLIGSADAGRCKGSFWGCWPLQGDPYVDA